MFSSFAENPMIRKNFKNLTNVVLYYTVYFNRHLSCFELYGIFTELSWGKLYNTVGATLLISALLSKNKEVVGENNSVASTVLYN